VLLYIILSVPPLRLEQLLGESDKIEKKSTDCRFGACTIHMAFLTPGFEPTTLVFIVLGVSGTELAFLAPSWRF
jgi:hypothetical protein